uniref:Uncharacterized protein n=1 Tax=Arundo donax TaxID=35708 RepID=A0A0A9GK57_ARUDO
MRQMLSCFEEGLSSQKSQGGLGIIDLRAQNKALVLKILHKFYNKADLPWVSLTWDYFYRRLTPPHVRTPVGSFWWRDIMSLSEDFLKFASCQPNCGKTVLFWSDLWSTDVLQWKYPKLFSFARHKKCSLFKFIQKQVNANFQLPLSTVAVGQLQDLMAFVNPGQWDENVKDVWIYIWGTQKISCKKAYNCNIGIAPESPLFRWMWRSSAQDLFPIEDQRMEGENEAVLVVCGKECDAAPMFDISTGEEIIYINDCVAPPSGLAYVAGRLLAASREDKDQPIFGSAIYFWATNKLQETHKSYVGEAIGPITCSKDGFYLVGGARSGNAYIWEVNSGALLKSWRAHKNAISSLSFSQDSSLVISGSEVGTVHVWCMISLFQVEEPQPHEDIKYCPNFCNTVKHEASITSILTILGVPCPMLITSSLDGSCKVTELMSRRLLHMLELSSPITATAIDPLEQLLICGTSDAAIYVTGLNGIGMQYSTITSSKDECQVLHGHMSPISALAFSSEGVWLVSGSTDCTVLVWDTTTWSVVRRFENTMATGPVTNLLVIPKPSTTMVQTTNSLAPEIPTLEKIFKPIDGTQIFLQPSSFSKDATSTHTCFHSSELLSKQISDLEGKRTPEALEMIVGITIDEQIKNQDLAKDLGDRNTVLQWKALNVMEVRVDLD